LYNLHYITIINGSDDLVPAPRISIINDLYTMEQPIQVFFFFKLITYLVLTSLFKFNCLIKRTDKTFLGTQRRYYLNSMNTDLSIAIPTSHFYTSEIISTHISGHQWSEFLFLWLIQWLGFNHIKM
jgi:hypothetical protein